MWDVFTWHGVDKILPYDQEEVLILSENGEYRVATYQYDEQGFAVSCTQSIEIDWKGKVAYWMQLPPPPKGRNGDVYNYYYWHNVAPRPQYLSGQNILVWGQCYVKENPDDQGIGKSIDIMEVAKYSWDEDRLVFPLKPGCTMPDYSLYYWTLLPDLPVRQMPMWR